MLDIPNYVTLPLELGVAFLILWMDRRQRKREANSIIRSQEQQKETREAEIRQRERFNNWAQESSKRQIMLLESIISTLDADKVDDFKTEVGSRYAEEISQDMNDLDDLLRRKQHLDTDDPELEADIESKIEEIESGTDFIHHFMPQETLDQINKIAVSAKTAYMGLKNIPSEIEKRFPDDIGSVKIDINKKDVEVDPHNPEEIKKMKEKLLSNYEEDRANLFDTLNNSLQQTMREINEDLDENLPDDNSVHGKIAHAVKSSLMNTMSFGKFKDKKEKEDEENDDTPEDSS